MRTRFVATIAAVTLACAEGTSEPHVEDRPIPPAGPHFSVSPVPLDSIASISPLGENNKIMPVGHSYWNLCDEGLLMNPGRPCVRANLDIRAPGAGVVFSIAPQDGHITIECPPGLFATFAHVTPVSGLRQGDAVGAGDVIARMFYDHSFDFGVMSYAVEHTFVRPERYPESYIHAQHPVELFAQPLRGQLEGRIQTAWEVTGRLSHDVAGTAAGNWFKEGSPASDEVFTPGWVHAQLFLGRLTQRQSTRIAVIGDPWSGMPNRLVVVDAADPSWDTITPTSGPVSLTLWVLSPDGEPRTDFPHGTLLVELLDERRLRIEWFDGHTGPFAFTGGARVYER